MNVVKPTVRRFMCVSYFVVIRAIGTLFDTRVLLHVANLDAHHGIHVESGQLTGFDDSDAHLEILGLKRVLGGVKLVLVFLRPKIVTENIERKIMLKYRNSWNF